MGSQQSVIEEKKKDNTILNILNVFPDIPDYRDYKYTLSELEEKNQVKKDLHLQINNVDNFNITDGYSIAFCISIIIFNELKIKGEETFLPSINYIFYNSLLVEYNTNNIDNLSLIRLSLRNTLKSLNVYGICPEVKCPFSDVFYYKPNEECYQQGKYYHFKYSRVENDNNIIKKLLNNNKLILINLTIYTSFLKNKLNKEGILDYPDEYDSILGMICCIIVGYTETKIILRTCFNEEWGNKGCFYIDYNYLSNMCNDLWLINVFIDKKKKFGLQLETLENNNSQKNNKKMEKNIDNNQEQINSMLRGSVF